MRERGGERGWGGGGLLESTGSRYCSEKINVRFKHCRVSS